MIRNVVSCDVCNVDKKETNHWFASWINEDGSFHSAALERAPQSPHVRHACGTDCNGKLLQRWMGTGKLDWPVARPEESKVTLFSVA